MAGALSLPEKVYMGSGALDAALPHICADGRRKALIITGRSMIAQGFADQLRTKLKLHNVDSCVYAGVTGEPTDQMVEAGKAMYQAESCDFLIGFGGGSQLDAAKAIGAMVVHPGSITDYNGKLFENELPYLVEIPSTAGTGSEATQVTIITDTQHGIKMLLKGTVLMPKLALIDPTYSANVPQNTTAWTGLDALTHAVEAYTSRRAFPECDSYALSAIRRIFQNLPLVSADGSSASAREQMALATYEGGVAICNSSVTIVHGMSRPIGALFHVPHGLSNAMLLRACLGFAADGAVDRFADIAREIGAAEKTDTDEAAAKRFLEELDRLLKKLHVPTLQEYGIPQADFLNAIPKMAEDAMASGSPGNTRSSVTIEDIKNIYRSML